MKRNGLLSLVLALGVVAAHARADAPAGRPQQAVDAGAPDGGAPAKPPSGPLVVLKSRSLRPYDLAAAGVRASHHGPLREFDLGGELEGAAQLASQIAALKPSGLIAIGAKAAKVARTYLAYLPLVYCLVLHPKRFGLSRSTGVPLAVPARDQLRTLRLLVPRARRIGLLTSPEVASERVREARDAARRLGLRLRVAQVRSAKEMPQALERLLQRSDALWILPAPSLVGAESFRFLLLQSFRRSVPVVGFAQGLVRAGALLALLPDYRGMGQLAAGAARRLLAGKKPGRIAPPEPRAAINATTARRLGLSIPSDLRARAALHQ